MSFLPGQHSFSTLVKAPHFSFGSPPYTRLRPFDGWLKLQTPEVGTGTGLHRGSIPPLCPSDWLRGEFVSQVRPKRLCLGKFVGEKRSLSDGIANHEGNVTPDISVAHLRAKPTGMKADLGARAGEGKRANLNDTSQPLDSGCPGPNLMLFNTLCFC